MPVSNKGVNNKKMKREEHDKVEKSVVSNEENIKKLKQTAKQSNGKEAKKVIDSDSDSSSDSSSDDSDSEKVQKKGNLNVKAKKEESSDESSDSSSDESSDEEESIKKEEKEKEMKKQEEKKKGSEKVMEKKVENNKKKVDAVKVESNNNDKKRKLDGENNTPTKKIKDSAEAKPVVTSSDPAVIAWREANHLTIMGDSCPAPYLSFEDGKFPHYVSNALNKLKFAKPTPIQSQTWPLALGNRDMIGLAETGSGKTLAFILPAVVHIMNKGKARSKNPSVLVLAPTRELAQQIESVTASMCAAAGIKSCCVYGGASKGEQQKSMQGAEVIIATPGRLIDFMNDGVAKLANVTYLVLDEADRMLDMGFELQINQIMREIVSPNRQTLMFSATWPSDVQRLSQKFFTNPVKITIGSEKLTGAKKVTQIVEVVEQKDRKKRLRQLLNQIFKDKCRILIFMLYKHTCTELAVELEGEGWPVGCINGNMSQNARDKTIVDFKSGAKPIMIATDVAARGLDIKDVKYVINVEFPLKCEDYIHRIGRTGRAGEAGTAYTFFSADDKAHARELVRIMKESNQVIDDGLAAIAEKAPGIKPKKSTMQEMYGDFAKGKEMAAKPTRITFD